MGLEKKGMTLLVCVGPSVSMLSVRQTLEDKFTFWNGFEVWLLYTTLSEFFQGLLRCLTCSGGMSRNENTERWMFVTVV